MILAEIADAGLLPNLLASLLAKGTPVFAEVGISNTSGKDEKHHVQITRLSDSAGSVHALFNDPNGSRELDIELLDSDDDDLELVKAQGHLPPALHRSQEEDHGMKVFEILDSDDSYELMTKLLKQAGFTVSPWTIRSQHALKIPFGMPLGRSHGRVQLKGDLWHYDVVGGQGHVLKGGTGHERDVIDFMTSYVSFELDKQAKKAVGRANRPVKEELLSKRERIALLSKLLSNSGFYARDDNFGWVNVFHLGDYSAKVTPHGQSWEIIASGVDQNAGHKEHRKRGKDEQAVIDWLTAFRPARKVKEDQDDDVPLVWKLAAQQKAKRKRVSIAAEVELKGMNFITGEIMADIPGAKVEIYAYSRAWYLPMRSEDDSRYTLVKDKQSDFYWVKDIDHEAE